VYSGSRPTQKRGALGGFLLFGHMTKKPLVFTTTHKVQFSELDPYNHVGTGRFATYFVDHRMQGLSHYVGWDVATLSALPYAVWARRLEIDFVRPVLADQEVTITSFVREFRGPDAFIECTMVDAAGKTLSRALMVVACVDKATNRGVEWPAEAMALFYESGRP
jgi:acyl-CoA thioester hydrolase